MATVESRKIGQDRLQELEAMLFKNKEKQPSKIVESVDGVDEEEILLYITNDGKLYSSMIQPVIKMLAKKIAKDNYDKELAPKAFMPVVEEGMKKYTKDFGSGKWNNLLTVAERKTVAKDLVDHYKEEMEELAQEMKAEKEAKKPSKKKESTEWGRKNVKVSTLLDNSQYFQKPTVQDYITVYGTGSSYNEAFNEAFDELYNLSEISEENASSLESYVQETYAEQFNDSTDQITPILQKEMGDSFDPEGNNETDLNVYVIISFEMPRALDNPSEEMPESVRRQLGVKKKVKEGEESASFIKAYFDENLYYEALVLHDRQYDTYYITPYISGETEMDFHTTLNNKKIGLSDYEIEYVADEALENILSRDSSFYLVKPEDLLESTAKNKFKKVRESEDDEDLDLHISDMILQGYTSGHYPHWRLSITGDVDANDDSVLSEIADKVRGGYTSGEVHFTDSISGETSRGWFELSKSKKESVSPRTKRFLKLAFREAEDKKKSKEEIASTIAKILGIKKNKNGRYNTSWGDKTAEGLIATVKRIADEAEDGSLAESRKTKSITEARKEVKYAVDYRDMHTAIHNLVVCSNKKDANEVYATLKDLASVDETSGVDDYEAYAQGIWDSLSDLIVDQFEINYRDIKKDGTYTKNDTVYKIINDGKSLDLY